MNRLTLRLRILLAFCLLYGLMLGVIGYTTFELGALARDFQEIHTGYLPLSRTAARLQSLQDRVDSEAARLADPTQGSRARPLAAYRSNLTLHARSFGATLAEARVHAEASLADAADLAAVNEHLDRLGKAQLSFERAGTDWVQLAERGDPGEEGARAGLLSAQRELETNVARLVAHLDSEIRRKSEGIVRTQREVMAVDAALAGSSLILGLVLLAWTLYTLGPIGRLTSEVQRVAAGDYSVRMNIGRKDEIGLLASEFERMAGALAERDRRLQVRAEELDRLSVYLKSVFDTIRLGLVVAEEGRVTMSNPSAREAWLVVTGEMLPSFLAELRPGHHWGVPVRERRFHFEAVPFGAAGRLVVGEDVTDRLHEEERRALTERLALIGKMLALVCHEVRNPLNAISLNAEMLGEELDRLDPARAGEGVDILSTLVAEIRRLEAVTERYLDLARGPVVVPVAEDVVALVQGVCRLEEPSFQRVGLSLRWEARGEVPMVLLDADQIRRVLHNVLRNAMQSGATRVIVRVLPDGDWVQVEVEDDGRGMDHKVLERAFEPFYTTSVRGTGLGLALSRQILELHGGSMHLLSAAGQGCTVVLRLPREAAGQAPEGGSSSSGSSSASEEAEGSRQSASLR